MKGKPWTKEEMDVLEQNYGRGARCHRLLAGRSKNAISLKARSLMIARRCTIDDFRELKKRIPMRSLAFYARELGVSIWTIRRYNKTIKIENYEAKRTGRTGG